MESSFSKVALFAAASLSLNSLVIIYIFVFLVKFNNLILIKKLMDFF